MRTRSRWSRIGRHLLSMVGGGAVMMTLMACYGMAHRMPAESHMMMTHCEPGEFDADGDGSCTPTDCDDRASEINPDAIDAPGDGIDANCDGVDGSQAADGATTSLTDERSMSSPGALPTVTPMVAPMPEAPPAPERQPTPMVAPDSV